MAPSKLSIIPRVVRPCEESWAQMTGNLRQRHCQLCDKQVHNFAAMTVAEIERLTIESGGRFCARMTQRSDGSLVTLETSPRMPLAAQIVISASLALSTAGAAAQAANDQPKEPEAFLTGTVLTPDGSKPVPHAVIRLRNETAKVIEGKANEAGEFSLSVEPGTYDLFIRQSPMLGARIAGMNLHSGEQSVQSVKTYFYMSALDQDPSAFVTMGTVAMELGGYSFKSAIRHPWSYLKYLARKL